MATSNDRETTASPPPTDRATLTVDGLSKTFGNGDTAVTAVDDVSFAVEPGRIVGLLGPNGAGKTTTIKAILGLITPDAGAVEIDGVDPHEEPKRAFQQVDAMLEGARNDYWRMTVRENLRYFSAVGGTDPDALAERHEKLLDQLDLRAKADESVRNLSRGMKQKVSLASVLASDVSIAFLDEPTLGLDIESSLSLREELKRIVTERDLTLVVSSHDMDVIEDICDRVIIMSQGRIVADAETEELVGTFETTGYEMTVQDLDEETVADLQARYDIADVTQFDERARLTLDADTETLHEFVGDLVGHDRRVTEIATTQPDLEEVFLEITTGDHQ